MGFVLFKDSYTRYGTGTFSDPVLLANFLSRYTSGAFASIGNDGRNGFAVHLASGGGAQFFKTLPHSSRWVIGRAYRAATQPSAVDPIYNLLNNNTQLFSLRHAADGTLALFAGSGTFIAVTDRSLFTNRWYYIELDITLSGSTVSVTAELRINGHVEASGTASTGLAATSLLSATANANVHEFGSIQGTGAGNSMTDLYIKNEAGYEGDVIVAAAYPDGDGGILDWTPNSGSSHFDRVNSHPVDATKFLSTATPGDIDLWTFTVPSFSGTIPGINISVLAQKNDEGTKSFKIVVGTTGTDAESDEFFVSDTVPEYYEFSLALDPATGMPWLPGQTIVAGVKLIS